MTRRAPAFVLGLAALVRTAAGLWLGFRPFDDTYITFRYSLNLASGHGFVYNLGEPVLGTTAPLWALVLALVAAVGAPIEHTALAISLACDAASAFFLFRLLGALGFGAGIPLAGAMLFLGFFDYFSLARSGMESSFFVFLVLGSLASVASRRFVVAAVFTALAALTRPEGALLVAVLPAALWYYRADLRTREAGTALAVLLAIAGSWAVYATLTFGSVVPQSVVAKAATFKDPALARFSWNNVGLFFLRGQYGGEIFTRTYLQLMPAISLLAGVGAAWLVVNLLRSRESGAIPRVALLLFFPCAYVAGMALSHAFTYFPWYYAPIYPFLAALAPIGTAAATRSSAKAVFSVTAALVAAQLAAAAVVKLPADSTFWVDGYFEVSDSVPRDVAVRVAAPEIGAVGWRVWPAAILDMEGLVTPEAVGVSPEAYLKLKRPEYLIVRTDNAAELLGTLQRDPWFAQTYDLVAVRRDPPGAVGRGYEHEAERFLRARGLLTIERNFRCRGGELDLVMDDAGTVVFVEVRYRRSVTYGTPGETVSRRKQQRILHAAQLYLASHASRRDHPCRIDIVAITGAGNAPKLDWIKNAFSA